MPELMTLIYQIATVMKKDRLPNFGLNQISFHMQ